MNDFAGAVAAGLSKEAPELPTTTLEFTKRVARVQTLIEAATATTLSEHDLSRGEYDILSTLRSAGAPYRLRPTDLSRRLLFTTGGTSNLLRSLGERGYIDRAGDPDDGRSSWVVLTDLGAENAIAVVRDAVAAQNRLLSDVDAGVLGRVIEGLAEVLAAVEIASTGSHR